MVQRTIGGEDLESLDPFLTLDEFRMSAPAPSASGKGSRARGAQEGTAGFPDHPHRGFETVTLMLQGHFQHEDFAGHKGMIGPGDVQWMTAGRGIVHAEMPLFLDEDDGGEEDANDDKTEGEPKEASTREDVSEGQAKGSKTRTRPKKKKQDIWGLQLWVNLPKAHKLCKPQYQELKDEKIPRWKGDTGNPNTRTDSTDHGQDSGSLVDATDDLSLESPTNETKDRLTRKAVDRNEDSAVEVKVIAGESHGVKSRVFTRTPTQYLEIKMKSHHSFTEWIPETYEGFVYVLEGRGYFGQGASAVEGRPHQLLVLSSVQAPEPTPNSTNINSSSTIGGDTNVNNKKKKKGKEIKDRSPAPLADNDLPAPEQGTSATATEPAAPPRSFLHIATKDGPLHMVLIAGEPCREPVFRQGPFVMASKDELEKTFRDYEEKKRGFERAQGWVSTIGGQRHKASSPAPLESAALGNAGGNERRKGRQPRS
ncbi:hypothetical protein BGX31_008084 [Mortierella sp. GBA43]|nr:hypothetical protein BGX31_008084 [Mortierella sp. GBA43]